jgi:flagellar hook-length control protein FliK
MNLILNNLNLSAAPAKAGAPAAANDAAAPLAVDATLVAGAGTAPAFDAAQPAPTQPALAFAQWLGLEQIAVPPGADGVAPAATDAAAPVAETPADEQPNADTPLLGAMAMAMPLMPVAQAALAAVVAALPGVPAAKESAPAADTDIALPLAAAPAKRDRRPEAAAAPVSSPVSAPALPAVETAAQPAPAVAPRAAAAPVALPAATLASKDDAPQDAAAPATERAAAHTFGAAAPAPGAAQRTADTVTLAGPPTAWRQTLQEALGERLQLQVGKNAEQAVIRLEPPMLGRVEIAIRHSAGSLEVNISATHGEVLRQLQSVSEGLRNDLAQRQFTDVAVNVAQAPRGANGAPMFTGGEGRGRQQDGRQQEQNPGEALAEANSGSSPFSLNGRGANRS